MPEPLIDNVILSALRLAAGQGWRPISEAPKDGTMFDCWGTHNGKGPGYRLPDCSYVMKNYGNDEWEGKPVLCCNYNRDVRTDGFTATHFRALPPPPGQEKKE